MSVGTNLSERRIPGARVPFEALVELAAPEASFEAESVNLSTEGMQLRTAYLPRVGTPLSFRFESSPTGTPIRAHGEVVWAQEGDGGCEFGVRFVDVAPDQANAIRRIVAPQELEPALSARAGAPVRIHIEGVGSPMRATLRGTAGDGAVVGSELKMLKLGAKVELEDRDTGGRSRAEVESVSCSIDPDSRIPNLVVKLRWDGLHATAARGPLAAETADLGAFHVSTPTHSDPGPMASRSELDEQEARDSEPQRLEAASVEAQPPLGERAQSAVKNGLGAALGQVKSLYQSASTVAARLGARVGNTVTLLHKRGEDGDGRRTTARIGTNHGKQPRSLRPQAAREGEGMDGMQEMDAKKLMRRRQVVLGAVGAGLLLTIVALVASRPAKPPVVSAPAPELAPASASASASALTALAPPPPVDLAPPPPAPPLMGDSTGLDAKGNPNPFGSTSLRKGTRMVLRLDGPVNEVKGMPMPNGFVVSVPNRKSLEAAGPLAAKDPRISSARVVNQPGGAELTVAFKEDAPNYVVRAKGDSLEIVLAHEKVTAKKSKAKGSGSKKDHASTHPHKKK